MYCELTWPVGISTVFRGPPTVPLHSPNDKQCLPLGLCKRLWKSLEKIAFPAANQISGWWCLTLSGLLHWYQKHDDVIKWKHFSGYWPFVRHVRGIQRSTVHLPHKGQWRGALIFALIHAWINGRVNSGEAGDLRRHYDVTIMAALKCKSCVKQW